MQVKKQWLEQDMKQCTFSKFGEEYAKGEYCHVAYLTYMQSTSYQMEDWIIKQAGIQISGRNVSNFRYADDFKLMAESEEEVRTFWLKVKKENEKN